MHRVSHTVNRAASVRLAHAAYLLTRAEHHLSAASSLTPDRYHRDRLSYLSYDLRSIYTPLTAIAQALEGERDR